MVADVRYERLVFAGESLGANAYAGKYALGDLSTNDLSTQGVNVFARYYPLGKSFFAGLGLGTAIQLGRFGKDNYDVTSFLSIAVVPELGWKIDIGEEGKFFIQPGLKVPFISGKLKFRNDPKTSGIDSWSNDSKYEAFTIYPYFGIGYAF
jgi:hypothetical protein